VLRAKVYDTGKRLELAQPSDGLHPAEALLDQFAFLLAHGIAGVARGAAVDGITTVWRRRVVRRWRRGSYRAPVRARHSGRRLIRDQ
jgi:hypothetical protein